MDTRLCLPVVENDCVLDGLLLGVGIAAATAAAATAPTATTERTAHTTSRTEKELKTIQCVHIYIYYLEGLFLTTKIGRLLHCTGNAPSGDKKKYLLTKICFRNPYPFLVVSKNKDSHPGTPFTPKTNIYH
jgi:hypothetical protein